MATKRIVEGLINKHKSNNPFVIADNLNIVIIYSDLRNTLGFFNKYKRSKFIHLNNKIPDSLKNFVCAHELGHAILHPNVNTPFLKKNTLFSVSKIEREANTFAVELLLTDNLIQEFTDCGFYNLASKCGIPPGLVCLKSQGSC